MTLPRSVYDVLTDHVEFEVECIDRMYLNVFVPELQRAGQVAGYLIRHLGLPIASTALVAPMSRQFVASIRDYARVHDVPVVHFAKGQRRDDVMHEHLAGFTGTDQVVLIGVAQEKAHVFRTERRHNPVTGARTRGSSPPRRWSTTTTSTPSMTTSARSSSSSAPTSPTPPGYASTATSTPNVRRPRPASASWRWTTGSPRSTTLPTSRRCSGSATT
jgi:hypothetical protein